MSEDTGTGSGEAAEGADGRPIGSHRAGMAQPPKISGSPPWDPAPPPPSDAPWAQPPMQSAGSGRILPAGPPSAPAGRAPGTAPEPELSPWDAIAEEAWPGGPAASRPLRPPPPQPPASGTEDESGSGGGPHQDGPARGSRPIYVWNPAASTENLPAVPPGENREKHQR